MLKTVLRFEKKQIEDQHQKIEAQSEQIEDQHQMIKTQTEQIAKMLENNNEAAIRHLSIV